MEFPPQPPPTAQLSRVQFNKVQNETFFSTISPRAHSFSRGSAILCAPLPPPASHARLPMRLCFEARLLQTAPHLGEAHISTAARNQPPLLGYFIFLSNHLAHSGRRTLTASTRAWASYSTVHMHSRGCAQCTGVQLTVHIILLAFDLIPTYNWNGFTANVNISFFCKIF